MKIKDRLMFIDQCIDGEIASFNLLLSKDIYDSFSRSYEIYRDYVKQKSKITDLHCIVEDNTLVLQIHTQTTIGKLLSDSIPKKGISANSTEYGVDLNITLINNNNDDI